MPKQPTWPEPQAGEFHLRPGSPLFQGQGWRGVNSESDPASLDPNELQAGVNVRLLGKSILTRPGNVLEVELDPANGEILWLKEAPAINPPVKLWAVTAGCLGVGNGIGGTLQYIDLSGSPIIQTYSSYLAATDKRIVLATFGGDVYVGDNSSLRRVEYIVAGYGQNVFSILTSPPNIPLVTFPGYIIRAMLETPDGLFISLENLSAIGSSKIVLWDGSAWTDDLTGVRPAWAFGMWQDKLVAGFDSTAAGIQVRDPGAAPGSWAAVGLAGYSTSAFANAMAEVGPKLWIAGGNSKLFSFDGTTLAAANTIASAAVDGLGITGVTLHNGLLYYCWNEASPYPSHIGRHDPDSTVSTASEWVDNYKDVTGDLATFKRVSTIADYRCRIVIGGSHTYIAATAYNDVKGSLQTIQTGSAAAGFDVGQLLRV